MDNQPRAGIEFMQKRPQSIVEPALYETYPAVACIRYDSSYRERPFWRFSGDTGPNLRDSFKGIEANKSAAGMDIDRAPSE